MSYGNDKPTPPMTDAERAARIDELDRVARWISTKDDWCTILSRVGIRRAQLKFHKENDVLPEPKPLDLKFTSAPVGYALEEVLRRAFRADEDQ